MPNQDCIQDSQSFSKDTIIVPPLRQARFRLCFPNYTTGEVAYMYHCHYMGHHDMNMMGQYGVQ